MLDKVASDQTCSVLIAFDRKAVVHTKQCYSDPHSSFSSSRPYSENTAGLPMPKVSCVRCAMDIQFHILTLWFKCMICKVLLHNTAASIWTTMDSAGITMLKSAMTLNSLLHQCADALTKRRSRHHTHHPPCNPVNQTHHNPPRKQLIQTQLPTSHLCRTKPLPSNLVCIQRRPSTQRSRPSQGKSSVTCLEDWPHSLRLDLRRIDAYSTTTGHLMFSISVFVDDLLHAGGKTSQSTSTLASASGHNTSQ